MPCSLRLPSLPRNDPSVPAARHLVRAAMRTIGVDADCTHDIELALSEACTNVLLHSGPGDQYVVRLDLEDRLGLIRVIDVGHGFDSVKLKTEDPLLDAERGRGLGLMQALVDRVDFTSRPEAGTIVTLEKDLTFSDGSLLAGHRKQV
jgi:anti-sigma regulatory factor (Ser/Thr protein kinase)